MGYALPTAILALLAPRFAVEGFGVVIAAAALAWALRSIRRTAGSSLAIAPLAAGLLVACAIAPDSVVGVILGGISALATVVWLGDNRDAPRPFIDRWQAVSLPGLAVAVAVVVSLALPTAHAVLGVAAALVAGVVLLIAYLLDR